MGMLLVGLPIFVSAGYVDYPKTHRTLEILIALSAKLGEALIIAALLIATVDEESRLRLIETVVRAASPKLLARHLPTPVKNAIFKYFSIYFYRSDLRLDYDLEPQAAIAGAQPYMKVTMRVKGSITNCGDASEAFPFYGEIDPPVMSGLPPSEIISAKVQDSKGNIVYEYKRTSASALPSGIESFQSRPYVPSAETYSTTFECVSYRPTTYFVPLFLGSTVLHATVSIRYPKDLFDVSVQLSTISEQEPQPEPTHEGTEWEVREPLLPGNCILTTWNPKIALSTPGTIFSKKVSTDTTGEGGML